MTSPASPQPGNQDELLAALAEIRDWDSAVAARHGHIGVREYAAQVLAAAAAGETGAGEEADDVDWSAHHGSCRMFYAERRCTCAPPPFPPAPPARQDPDLQSIADGIGDLVTAAVAEACRQATTPEDDRALSPRTWGSSVAIQAATLPAVVRLVVARDEARAERDDFMREVARVVADLAATRARLHGVRELLPRVTELAEFEQEAGRDAVALFQVRDHLRRVLDGPS